MLVATEQNTITHLDERNISVDLLERWDFVNQLEQVRIEFIKNPIDVKQIQSGLNEVPDEMKNAYLRKMLQIACANTVFDKQNIEFYIENNILDSTRKQLLSMINENKD